MSKPSLILAIETANREWSVSLLRGTEEVSSRTGDSKISGSEVLLASISDLLKENQIEVRDLTAIAVSRGPGSFTGIRVGLATAQALAYASRKICVGIPLFEAMALMFEKNEGNGAIFVATSAGQNQLYWQSFSVAKPNFWMRSETQPSITELSDFKKIIGRARPDSSGESSVKIITDSKTRFLINEHFGFQENKVKVASDNVSKYIGLRFFELMEEKGIFLTETEIKIEYSNDFQSTVTPLYIRNVRIGK